MTRRVLDDFNSNMVRLKDAAQVAEAPRPVDFNSNMVRLKVTPCSREHGEHFISIPIWCD